MFIKYRIRNTAVTQYNNYIINNNKNNGKQLQLTVSIIEK